jgi:hypothetical protein
MLFFIPQWVKYITIASTTTTMASSQETSKRATRSVAEMLKQPLDGTFALDTILKFITTATDKGYDFK